MHLLARCTWLCVVSSTLSAQTPPATPSVNSTVRSTTRLAEGIYLIRHADAPNGFPQGNTTVIVGNNAVMVVDSDYLPSSAREDIADIRQWTDKPVRYLVNTHWHFDHTFGNGAYNTAFPGLSILAHRETVRQMVGWNAAWLASFPERTNGLKTRIEKRVEADGKRATAERVDLMRRQLEIRERIWREFEGYQITLPNLTFEQDLQFDLGNRVVWVRYLGRGNTVGDVVVHVPDAQLVATGDLLTHPVPYLAGGHPADLAGSLDSIAALGVKILVPGHGEVQRDLVHLRQVAQFIRLVVGKVDSSFFIHGTAWGNVDQVRDAVAGSIDLAHWRRTFSGDDSENISFFDGYTWPGLIEAAYAEAWGR